MMPEGKRINADTAPPPEKWGVDEMMRFLMCMVLASPTGKACVRKDVFRRVNMNMLNAIGIKDCGQFYLIQLAKEAHGSIIIPEGGLWFPS
jgi:hypothetical protein